MLIICPLKTFFLIKKTNVPTSHRFILDMQPTRPLERSWSLARLVYLFVSHTLRRPLRVVGGHREIRSPVKTAPCWSRRAEHTVGQTHRGLTHQGTNSPWTSSSWSELTIGRTHRGRNSLAVSVRGPPYRPRGTPHRYTSLILSEWTYRGSNSRWAELTGTPFRAFTFYADRGPPNCTLGKKIYLWV